MSLNFDLIDADGYWCPDCGEPRGMCRCGDTLPEDFKFCPDCNKVLLNEEESCFTCGWGFSIDDDVTPNIFDTCQNCGVEFGIEEMEWDHCHACGWKEGELMDEYEADLDDDQQ